MPAPIFLPFYRTSVRYNEFRCDCVRVVYSIRYVRLCASRLSSRHVVLSCVSSRAIRCVVSSVGSFRPSFRSPSCLAPFRSAVRSFSSRLPWRDCLAFPCRLVSHWHPVCPSSRSSSCRSVSHAVSSCSSRSRSSSRSRRPGGVFVSVFMPVPRVRTVPPCSSLVPVRLFGLGPCPRCGAGLCVMSMERGRLALIVLFVPSLLLLATHSLVAGWRREDEVMEHRFMLLAARSFSAHVPSFSSSRRPLALIAFSHPLIHEARRAGTETEAKSDKDRTGTRKTRRIERDARRDE